MKLQKLILPAGLAAILFYSFSNFSKSNEKIKKQENKKYHLVLIKQDHCPPCQKTFDQIPEFKEIMLREGYDFEIENIDFKSTNEYNEIYEVKTTPTFILFDENDGFVNIRRNSFGSVNEMVEYYLQVLEG